MDTKSKGAQVPYIKLHGVMHTAVPLHSQLPKHGSKIVFNPQLIESMDVKPGDIEV